VVDVSDPALPSKMGASFFPSWVVSKPVAYKNYISFYIEYKDDAGAGIEIVDVSDPLNPTDIAFLDVCLTDNNPAIYCDYAYKLCDDTLRVIDLSDPFNMSIYSSIMLAGINSSMVKVDSGYAYIPNTIDGLQILRLW
ncbi:MAG: hypothetical protein ABIG42_00685, partial [bacterium]